MLTPTLTKPPCGNDTISLDGSVLAPVTGPGAGQGNNANVGGSTAAAASIHRLCLCDEDGATVTPFTRAYAVSFDGTLTSTLIGDFTDDSLATPYTVTGTAIDCAMAGSAAQIEQLRQEVTGATWSPNALIRSYTVRVVSGTGVTFTDSNGITTTLASGEVFTYSHDAELLDTAPIVTVPPGEQVVITYTQLASV